VSLCGHVRVDGGTGWPGAHRAHHVNEGGVKVWREHVLEGTAIAGSRVEEAKRTERVHLEVEQVLRAAHGAPSVTLRRALHRQITLRVTSVSPWEPTAFDDITSSWPSAASPPSLRMESAMPSSSDSCVSVAQTSLMTRMRLRGTPLPALERA
jgi:hypothetical protein